MKAGRRHVLGARATLGWGALAFLGFQMILNVAVVEQRIELQDLEFAQRLKMLRARIAENPHRPLLLMLGSSRTVASFMPEKLPPLQTASGEQPLVFNFSHLGAGPGMNLLELHRLLRNGIRPDWLMVEIMPPQLGDPSQSILTSLAGATDLPVTSRYLHPLKVYGRFARGHLVPCYKYRRFLIHHAVPDWLPPGDWQENQFALGPLGGDYGLFKKPPELPPALAQQQIALARADYFPDLQDLRVVDLSNRAMHELLGICRKEGIPVVLFISPEGKDFQSWYAPRSRKTVDDFCTALSREYRVPLIDARNWLDERGFLDSHHMLLRGAEEFTEKLGRWVLRPLVAGKPLAGDGLRPVVKCPQPAHLSEVH
jgi:hypothetical protein